LPENNIFAQQALGNLGHCQALLRLLKADNIKYGGNGDCVMVIVAIQANHNASVSLSALFK